MLEDCIPLMKLLIEFQNVTLLHTEDILLQCWRHKMALHIFFAFIMTHQFLFDLNSFSNIKISELIREFFDLSLR